MSDKPIMIGYDPAFGPDESILARVRSAGGTAIEIVELQKAAQPVLDRMAKILDNQIFTGLAAMRMCFIDGNLKVKEIPSWRFYKPAQIPQWLPPIRRPQQRSASMRKHARIVRSRMTPNERRQRQAQWERSKRVLAAAGVINPNASKFWKDFF